MNYTFTERNGSITITGYGGFDSPTDLIIPERINGMLVETIGEEAFANGEYKSVVLPESIKTIKSRAFVNCAKLNKVLLNYGLSIIEEYAFCSCKSLRKLDLPKTINRIEGYFIDGTKISSLFIPASLTHIMPYFCHGVKSLSSVYIEEGVEYIDSKAFSDTNIKKVVIPNSVKRIGTDAFDNVKILIKGNETMFEREISIKDYDYHAAIGEKSIVFCNSGSNAKVFCERYGYRTELADDFYGFVENENKSEKMQLNNKPLKEKSIKTKGALVISIPCKLKIDGVFYPFKMLLEGKNYKFESNVVVNSFHLHKGKFNDAPRFRIVGSDNDGIHILLLGYHTVLSSKNLNVLSKYLMSIFSERNSAILQYCSDLRSVIDDLYSGEIKQITSNFVSSIDIEVLLNPFKIAELQTRIIEKFTDTDSAIIDAFMPLSELQRVKQFNDEYRIIKSNKNNGIVKEEYLVENNKLPISEEVEDFFKTQYLKYYSYVKSTLKSHKRLDDDITYQIKNKTIKMKVPTYHFICVSFLYKAIRQMALNRFENIYLPNSLPKCITELQRIHGKGFISENEKCLFAIVLCEKGVLKSDYLGNYYRVLSELKMIEKNDDIESFKSKYISNPKKRLITIADVDMMTGIEFEDFLCELFQKDGYKTSITKASGDQGIDVLLERHGLRIGVQAKCYSSTVGNFAIQEAVAGKMFYNCDKVMVVTNNYFTNAAIELAKANDVILWDRNMLKEKMT
ncbi:MAG TPA: hypothetical protein DCR23_00055 [Ruminococcaceae bacterium]|nr:hypothetical protein [Oscillospiraceae bacterium]